MTLPTGGPHGPEDDPIARTVSVIVPTRNEAGNIERLVERIALAVPHAEVIFVDDSDDDTPAVIRALASSHRIPIRLIHRAVGTGGLSGAVVEGLRVSDADRCVVMDGDLQHPPELIPALVARGNQCAADIVVASRHQQGGSVGGLDGWLRHGVSSASTLLTRGMFPRRLRDCTDPMSGFFAVRRDRLDVMRMKPRGFKILLEILAHHRLSVIEEPFVFGTRDAGQSKASAAQGLQFLAQLAALRFGRLSRFAAIGAFGALVNLAIMAGLVHLGMWYVSAAAIAGAATIVLNFALQERFVFRDLRTGQHSFRARFVRSFGFNASETALRTLALWMVVEFTVLPSIFTQAALLGVGFLVRFVYHSLVVYRPRPTSAPSPIPEALPAADHIPQDE